MKKSTEDWFKSAESDLLLVKEIHLNQNLTHLSAFHCQQAIEKSFKAIIEEFDLPLVKTHSLETLYNSVKEKIRLKFNNDSLIILDQLYIDSRYPGEMGLLPNGKPSADETRKFFDLATDIFKAASLTCRE
jgi:HEPN domain-containing protein